jgi:hypothetical protein
MVSVRRAARISHSIIHGEFNDQMKSFAWRVLFVVLPLGLFWLTPKVCSGSTADLAVSLRDVR